MTDHGERGCEGLAAAAVEGGKESEVDLAPVQGGDDVLAARPGGGPRGGRGTSAKRPGRRRGECRLGAAQEVAGLRGVGGRAGGAERQTAQGRTRHRQKIGDERKSGAGLARRATRQQHREAVRPVGNHAVLSAHQAPQPGRDVVDPAPSAAVRPADDEGRGPARAAGRPIGVDRRDQRGAGADGGAQGVFGVDPEEPAGMGGAAAGIGEPAAAILDRDPASETTGSGRSGRRRASRGRYPVDAPRRSPPRGRARPRFDRPREGSAVGKGRQFRRAGSPGDPVAGEIPGIGHEIGRSGGKDLAEEPGRPAAMPVPARRRRRAARAGGGGPLVSHGKSRGKNARRMLR